MKELLTWIKIPALIVSFFASVVIIINVINSLPEKSAVAAKEAVQEVTNDMTSRFDTLEKKIDNTNTKIDKANNVLNEHGVKLDEQGEKLNEVAAIQHVFDDSYVKGLREEGKLDRALEYMESINNLLKKNNVSISPTVYLKNN